MLIIINIKISNYKVQAEQVKLWAKDTQNTDYKPQIQNEWHRLYLKHHLFNCITISDRELYDVTYNKIIKLFLLKLQSKTGNYWIQTSHQMQLWPAAVITLFEYI